MEIDKNFWINIFHIKLRNFANKYYRGFKGATKIELADNYRIDKSNLEKYYLGINKLSDYESVEIAETKLRDFFFKYKPSDINAQGVGAGIEPLDDYPDGLYKFKYKNVRIAFSVKENESILLFAIVDRNHNCYQTIFNNYQALNPKKDRNRGNIYRHYYRPLLKQQLKAQHSWIELQDRRK